MALRRFSRAGQHKRKAAREAVKNLEPAHREAIEASGYGPGDAYIALWDAIVEIRQSQQAIAQKLTSDALKPGTRVLLERQRDYFRDRFIQTLAVILPYERPKLAMVQFKGELTDAPVIDLTKLPDAQLQQLKEITLLLTGAASGQDR